MNNNALQGTFLRPFTISSYIQRWGYSGVHLDSHDALSKYLYMDIADGEIEIPVALLAAFRTSCSMSNRTWEQIAMPLLSGKTMHKSTFNSIIKEFFLNTALFESRLTKVITSKGEVYYGGPGMIFNKDMVPYILYTVTLSDVSVTRRPWTAKAEALNVRVNPCVFTDMDDMMKKGIISRMIPTLVSSSLGYVSDCEIICDRRFTPTVIVEDLSRWFEEPEKVKDVNTFNEDMKDFLSKEDIIQDIIRCL